jgi:hypothetical protein
MTSVGFIRRSVMMKHSTRTGSTTLLPASKCNQSRIADGSRPFRNCFSRLTYNALVADMKSAARARGRSGKLDGTIVPLANGLGATCLSNRPVDTVAFAFPCRLLPLQPRFIQHPFRGQRTGTARSKGSPVENRTYEILNARKVQIFMRTNHLGPEWMH